MVAARAERTGTVTADPTIATFVAFLLFGQSLAKAPHQFFQAAKLLDLRFFLVGEHALEFAT